MDVFLVKFLFLSAVILLSWGGLKCELRWEPSAEQHQPLLTAATALNPPPLPSDPSAKRSIRIV